MVAGGRGVFRPTAVRMLMRTMSGKLVVVASGQCSVSGRVIAVVRVKARDGAG
jgi:hypothetical protein